MPLVLVKEYDQWYVDGRSEEWLSKHVEGVDWKPESEATTEQLQDALLDELENANYHSEREGMIEVFKLIHLYATPEAARAIALELARKPSLVMR